MRPENEYLFTIALIVCVLAVARATRLIVDDRYPPTEWLKFQIAKRLPGRWDDLFECPWCTAPYIAAPAVGWFVLLVAFPSWTWLVYVWWIVNGWAAVSWLAAFATLRDTPAD